MYAGRRKSSNVGSSPRSLPVAGIDDPPSSALNRKRVATGVCRRQPSLRSLLVLLLASIAATVLRASDSLPPPRGEVLLVVSGNLTRANVGDEVHLDRALIESFPSLEYTYTSFASGKQSLFEGLRLGDLLATVGSDSTRLRASAADDYHAVIEDIDFERYPIMIAYRENGTRLTLRTLGPLRIVYPFDDYPEIINDVNLAATVWQLTHLELL